MKIINGIFSKMDWKMDTPGIFGLFHIVSILVMIATILIIARAIKKDSEKTVKIVVFSFCVVSLLLEVVKQGLFTYVESEYQWYAFPFQFCSTPMYISLLSLIIKNQKVKQALYAFLGLFGLFGGLIVMIYPGDVFMSLVMINIQTMIHHAGMVIVGVTLLLAKKVSFDFKSLLKATCVFLGLILVAQSMNIIAHYAEIGTFNMFFISPYESNHLPVLSNIQANQPFLVFLFSYIGGFTFAAFLIQKTYQLIRFCCMSISKRFKKETMPA